MTVADTVLINGKVATVDRHFSFHPRHRGEKRLDHQRRRR